MFPCFPSDPFAAVFGSESFGGGFADFSALAKVGNAFFVYAYEDFNHNVSITDAKWRLLH